MQPPRGFTRSHRSEILCFLALAAAFLASACAPGSARTLTGVGCADPSCNEVVPETRKVLGCIGEACNEPPPASAAKKVAGPAGGEPEAAPTPVAGPAGGEPETAPTPVAGAAGGERGTASPTVAASGADSAKGPEAKTDGDDSSDWDLKVYYEPHRRP